MMHIHSMKEVTRNKEIISLENPDLFLIPLFEKFGSEPKPVVVVGDRVKKYQVIAKSKKGLSSPCHAPVSGIVEKIESIEQMDGTTSITIFIRNDGMETEMYIFQDACNINSPKEILQRIEDAGIVGMGGAQFPTAIKYNRKDKKVDTFIINAVECEPYLTGDCILMREYPQQILEGILLVDKLLEAEEIVIAFERSNNELEAIFNNYIEKDNRFSKIRMQILPNIYPQGGELQLAKVVTGVVIKKKDVPLEQGIVVSNVATVYAVYDAVINHKPLTERVITVSGEGISEPGNYRIKVGTPVSHIIKSLKIDTENYHIIGGGPMMSPYIRNFRVPLHKGSLGVLALPKDSVERLNCIWCGYCVDVCPMMLMPMKYVQFYNRGQYHKLEAYDINDCIECAACEYICPSNVSLIESIQEGKKKLKKIKDASDKEKI